MLQKNIFRIIHSKMAFRFVARLWGIHRQTTQLTVSSKAMSKTPLFPCPDSLSRHPSDMPSK